MRCLVCEKFSFSHMCQRCQDDFLVPQPEVRTLSSGLKVLSFFAYDEIDFLLKTKHSYLGHYIYKILADKTMRAFTQAFRYETALNVVPIDDKAEEGYAHTAVLAKRLKSRLLKPLYQSLHAQNPISYSGKDLAFRKANPRNFKLKRHPTQDVILVDDIITSGTTLSEAHRFLEKQNIQTIMAITLADANR